MKTQLFPQPASARRLCPPLSALRLPLSALLLLLLFSLPVHASSDPSLLPDGRQGVELRPSERNPFAQQIAPEVAPTTTQEGATEDSRLRRIFRAMKIGGASGKAGEKRVLLGSLIVKPGDTLPPILNNQIEMLRVLSVDDSSIVLAFVEKDPSASARQIVLGYKLKPEVSRVMFGEAFEELTKVGPGGKIDAPPLTIQGVNDLLKGSREADLRNMADRDVQMMGVVQDVKPTEKKK
ncbi:MAG: hypothetical protein WC076_07860 [Terrimicrobiaceae bacterium]|nr:hypothetical protein [Terrimicrobiaceae bacterium]